MDGPKKYGKWRSNGYDCETFCNNPDVLRKDEVIHLWRTTTTTVVLVCLLRRTILISPMRTSDCRLLVEFLLGKRRLPSWRPWLVYFGGFFVFLSASKWRKIHCILDGKGQKLRSFRIENLSVARKGLSAHLRFIFHSALFVKSSLACHVASCETALLPMPSCCSHNDYWNNHTIDTTMHISILHYAVLLALGIHSLVQSKLLSLFSRVRFPVAGSDCLLAHWRRHFLQYGQKLAHDLFPPSRIIHFVAIQTGRWSEQTIRATKRNPPTKSTAISTGKVRILPL